MKAENENGLRFGWIQCLIEDIVLPIQRIDPKSNPDRKIIYIDISGIDNVHNKIGAVKQFCLGDAPCRARQIVQCDDVLFSTVRPYLRNIASVPDNYDGQIASTGFSILRPAKDIDPAFLFYKVISAEFVNAVSGKQYGVSYPAVKDEQVRGQPVCLPPAAEQRRIVAKIEELFSELDKGIESLKTAREQLKVYRQALLKHAFEGKLTAQWRKENEDKLETTEQILARIRAERQARYQRQLKDWETAVKDWEAEGKPGRKPSKPRSLKVAPILNAEDVGKLSSLPLTWSWVRLSELFSSPPQNGLYKPADAYGHGTQIIRIDDFYDGKLVRTSGFKRLSLSCTEAKKYSVKNSELIINRVNSIEYLGKCALVDGLLEETVFESNIMKCTLLDVVSKKYVTYYLASFDGRNRLCDNAKHAVNQASINQADVGITPLPLPSLEEQAHIVQTLEQTLSQSDALMQDIDAHLIKAGTLRQAILKKAFSGQLVEQDPTDEPASALLARIKAERAEQTNSDKNNKRKDAA